MHSATRFLALTAPLTGLLLTLAVSATPHNKDISLSGFRKRQDDGSGVGAEDAGPDEINTEGTGPLRSGKWRHVGGLLSVTDINVMTHSCRRSEPIHRSTDRNMVPNRHWIQ